LGVEIMAALLRQRWVIGREGTFDPTEARMDRLPAAGHDVDYCVTPNGEAMFGTDGARETDGRRIAGRRFDSYT
jgi:hypothetical protein